MRNIQYVPDASVPIEARRHAWSIGPGKRDICPELGRWSQSPRNAKPVKCKRPSLGTSKADLLILHRLKMNWKALRNLRA